MTEAIGRDEFVERLEALCIGGSTGLPKRIRDLHILLASATLWMDSGTVYGEAEVNSALERWLEEGCPSLGIDVVTLRRQLVDHLYLDRDDSGRLYSPGRGPVGWRFADEIASVDPTRVVRGAMERRAARKTMYTMGSE